jgi:hypothetical protein
MNKADYLALLRKARLTSQAGLFFIRSQTHFGVWEFEDKGTTTVTGC